LPKRDATARKSPRPATAAAKTAKPAAKSAKAKTPARTAKKPVKPAAKPAKVTKIAKKPTAKPAPKAPVVKVAKGPEAKAPAKAPASKPVKPEPKAAAPAPAPTKPGKSPKVVPPPVAEVIPAAAPEPAGDDKKAPARKPMTVVGPKSKKGKTGPQMPRYGEPLLKPGAPAPKPLISSGPKAAPPQAPLAAGTDKPVKSPLDKKTLESFRVILLHKRAELVGDVNTMETEALMSQSGALSHLPQHMAEQGSDAYGQSLSLDLAAADRRLIKEIDDALIRIQQNTFGVCELTGKPIKLERLNELPWARYSIEAARELERRKTSQ
jgi:DnaK suppressor protein